MDNMFGDGENLKDGGSNSNLALKDSPFSVSYSKTNKLVTALYMVTDVMDKDEPLRNKLRSLGAGIISDIYLLQTPIASNVLTPLDSKISEVLSFLDIASTVGMISAMNCNILKKEFTELQKSILESKQNSSLAEFLREELPSPKQYKFFSEHSQSPEQTNVGHKGMSIGVQRGSTLMKALSDKTSSLSNTKTTDNANSKTAPANNFNILKKQRREEITNIVKDKKEVTITDIKTNARGVLVACGEKTLQRELVSMVKDGLLYRTGEKRWSRYSLPK